MPEESLVTGLSTIVANFRIKKDMIGKGVERGVKKAALFLQRESVMLVPVDTGNLKASAFTRARGSGFETIATVGYTAAYALFVHESVAMKLKGLPRPPPHKGFFWDPQGKGQAKFLEEPARRLRKELREIILKEAKV